MIWNFPDAIAIFSFGGIPGEVLLSLTLFIICFVIVILVQRFVSEDEWKKAVMKGVVMGALAAAPFSILTFVGRSIYKSVAKLSEATQIGLLVIPWRDFETRAIARAKSLGMKPGNGDYEIAKVIPFLVANGVIAASDEPRLRAIRSGKRNPTMHTATKGLEIQDEKLLQKYIDIL